MYLSLKQIFLVFGVLAAPVSMVAMSTNELYQYKRFNGQVMPSTGTSKQVTITVADVQEPMHVFFDYNYSKVPLSQRITLTPEQKSAKVTLMPGSEMIQVTIIPQKALSEYLNFMDSFNYKKYRLEDKGVQLLSGLSEHDRQQQQKLFRMLNNSTNRVASIIYDKISAGEEIELPNPFVKAQSTKEEVSHHLQSPQSGSMVSKEHYDEEEASKHVAVEHE